MKRECPYDKKYFIKCLAGLCGMVVLMKATGGSGFAIMLPALLLAALLRKTEQLLFLLVLTIAMMVGNSQLMPKNSIFGYAQRGSMVLTGAVMLLQVSGQKSHRLVKPLLGMLVYLLFMAATAASGWCPFISYLKLFLFLMVFMAYYGIATTVANAGADRVRRVRSVFLALACFIILGSTLLIPFPGYSQMRAEAFVEALKAGQQVSSLFCGITFHSQALGPICALLGTAIFADLVFGIRRPDKLYILLLLCIPILLWRTSSRTAMGSFIAGLGLCFFFVLNARGLRQGWKMKIINCAFVVFVSLAVTILVVPSTREKIATFVLKHNTSRVSTSQMTTEDIFVSRQGLWDLAIDNFKRSPVVGNGFQVSENMKGLKPGFGVLSAPVEKSTWVTAILEEGGVVGFGIFVWFMLFVIFKLKRARAYVGLSCFVVFMVINLGEFTMFSMSGIGGFAWALIFIGVVMDACRLREQQMRQQMAMPPQPQWTWR